MADRVAATMVEMKTRFPQDLDYDLMYDTTVFVKATIEEVIHTLVEAFILVALVVFVFLGKLRTTLIPLLAVPVSIIGTFAVMLAIGYSANTVSLLALVLAIGIVVDDAIVVIENVERVMEEEPELSVKEATRKAMGEITAPIIAITMVLLSVFVPVAFIPGITGELFRQFAIAVSVSMLISAINALSLAPALCSVLLTKSHGRGRGPGGLDAGHRPDDGGLCLGRAPAGPGLDPLAGHPGGHRLPHRRHLQGHPAGLPAGGGPGRHLRHPATAGGASQNRTATTAAEMDEIIRREPAVESVTAVIGYDFINAIASSNKASSSSA